MSDKSSESANISENSDENRLSAALASFLTANPYSSVALDNIEPNNLIIENPWGDQSVELFVQRTEIYSSKLVDALNNVVLPERYIAIYHTDLRSLEVIWTAAPLSDRFSGVFGRSFEFNFENKAHYCKFANSSERLLNIAIQSRPAKSTDTNYRHLSSFARYAGLRKDGNGDEKKYSETGPISFWIDNVELTPELDTLVSNLNFYLKYYDFNSPIILVHDAVKTSNLSKGRYIKGSFPNKITSKTLDENLLSFWNFTGRETNQNPMISFILYYRLIEYAAYHYMDYKIKLKLKKIICAPDFVADSPATLEKIVGVFGPTALEEIGRFRALIRDCVSPSVLWPDVKANLSFFATDTVFDGGFVVKAFVNNKETEQSFDHTRVFSFAETIRKIRNTLSHGKDQETAGVITPTIRNLNLLTPWVHLIATVAGEVVLYKDVT